MSGFEVGQRVVCVSADFDNSVISHPLAQAKWPQMNAVYTVDKIRSGSWPELPNVVAGLVLKELNYPWGFDSRAFRPLCAISTAT